jgi:opacity protein-like surface antigen
MLVKTVSLLTILGALVIPSVASADDDAPPPVANPNRPTLPDVPPPTQPNPPTAPPVDPDNGNGLPPIDQPYPTGDLPAPSPELPVPDPSRPAPIPENVPPDAPLDQPPNLPPLDHPPVAPDALPAETPGGMEPASVRVIPIERRDVLYPASGIGIGVTLGGGVSGFTNRSMRDALSGNVGGLWDVRATFGTHTPIGVEVGYIGTAANINTFSGAANGTLVGTTAEATVRWNVVPNAPFTPYVFGGVGWTRYDVNDIQFATSDSGLKKTDDLAEFPVGVGMAWRDPAGLVLDLRGTYRQATDSTLVLDGRTGQYADLNAWEASAALGYEF